MAKSVENDEMSNEQRKAILDERAALLAATSNSAAKLHNQLEILEFLIADEKFAIEAKYVREASKLFTLTKLPCTPEFVLGLINFRGQILPLLDLREILELKGSAKKSDLQVVVVQTALGKAGIAVDEIAGISAIPESDLQSPKQLVRPSLAPLFKGVRNDRLVLLDIETLFADQRLRVESSPQEMQQ
jgi:purine-binding chemotaxis protein CheW